MAPVTRPVVGKDQKAYERAWAEKPPEFKPCDGCKTSGYCAKAGCSAEQAKAAKAMEG